MQITVMVFQDCFKITVLVILTCDILILELFVLLQQG